MISDVPPSIVFARDVGRPNPDAIAEKVLRACQEGRVKTVSGVDIDIGFESICFHSDTLGALATIANLKDGASTTTIESKTNFIGAATVGSRVVGETTPLHRGGRTMVWQTRVTTIEGKLVAIVMQTQLLL